MKVVSAETRRKLSEALKGIPGRPQSEETRRKISASRMGIEPWNKGVARGPVSDETRQKLSEALKGKPAWNKGIPRTPEIRAKLSAAMEGRAMPESTRLKLIAANTGRVKSDEERQKLSAAQRGRPKSDEARRKLSQTMKGRYCGPESPHWRGGASFEPYCVKFNNEFRERVRVFFGRRCVECGVPENGKRLAVHHVNFAKQSCCSEEVEPLFVALCPSCHGKTNHNRDFWEARFTALIAERYGGQCYIPRGARA
jgi:hypothetical protein